MIDPHHNANGVGCFSAEKHGENTPAISQRGTAKFSSRRQVADALLEAAIAVAAVNLGHAQTDEEKRECWQELANLHAQRSAESVAALERARGLAP